MRTEKNSVVLSLPVMRGINVHFKRAGLFDSVTQAVSHADARGFSTFQVEYVAGSPAARAARARYVSHVLR